MSRAAGALPTLDYVALLSDDTGVIQHANESIPNRSTGYCTDDVSRALMVALAYLRLRPGDPVGKRLATTYLSFLHDAQIDDGRFRNFMDYDRTWLDEVGTQDSVGRAMWALGYAVRYAPEEPWQRLAWRMLSRSLDCVDWLEHPRAQAYAMLGLSHGDKVQPEPCTRALLRHLADALVARYRAARRDDWQWFDETMTYDNARLPEAVLRAGEVVGDDAYREVALTTLDFYERVTFENGIFVPIGNEGWYTRGGARARYAQQPLEATAMVDAELAAFDATRNRSRLAAAATAFAWFLGKNSTGTVMAHGDGCYDGLGPHDANANMGAESTLAYLAGAYAMAERRAAALKIAR